MPSELSPKGTKESGLRLRFWELCPRSYVPQRGKRYSGIGKPYKKSVVIKIGREGKEQAMVGQKTQEQSLTSQQIKENATTPRTVTRKRRTVHLPYCMKNYATQAAVRTSVSLSKVVYVFLIPKHSREGEMLQVDKLLLYFLSLLSCG